MGRRTGLLVETTGQELQAPLTQIPVTVLLLPLLLLIRESLKPAQLQGENWAPSSEGGGRSCFRELQPPLANTVYHGGGWQLTAAKMTNSILHWLSLRHP